MDATPHVVRRTITHYAGLSREELHWGLRLEADLHLHPLDLVQIAVQIEDLVEKEIPIEGLALVRTVGDLLRFFAQALSPEAPREAFFNLEWHHRPEFA